MAILVTGGAGYIGSHTVVELVQAGYEVVIADNLSNSKPEAVQHIQKITGMDIPFEKVELTCGDEVRRLFAHYPIDAVIHFAGLKAVGESVRLPLEYYRVNMDTALCVLQAMREFGVRDFVFSSSATIYGGPHRCGVTEDYPYAVQNPYGRTKQFIEEILRDLYRSDSSFRIAILRYFNPAGAHGSGLIGEDPCGTPNNLVPYIARVAIGRKEKLLVFGDDYDTPDGTGIRDYIHVVDLAKGHIAALKKLNESGGFLVYNLGTGRGSSVFEVIHAFEEACGKKIPWQMMPRRPGDIDMCFANPSLAMADLGWRAELSLLDMCRDVWNWQTKYPDGYGLE